MANQNSHPKPKWIELHTLDQGSLRSGHYRSETYRTLLPVDEIARVTEVPQIAFSEAGKPVTTGCTVHTVAGHVLVAVDAYDKVVEVLAGKAP